FLTGVVLNDTNGNGKYDVGEGVGGVTITVAGAGFTTSFGSGGYSLQLSPGTYTVTASGGLLASPLTATVTVGGNNVRLNFNVNAASVAACTSWVKLLYKDLLGRTPGNAEVNSWVAALQTGLSRDAVVGGFLRSDEYYSRLVAGYFQKYLNRAPDPAG